MADQSQISELVEKMTDQRDKLLAQIEELSDEQASYAPPDAQGEAGWSPKEQCAHLAEMETAYRKWVELALAEDNPDLTGVRGELVDIPLENANSRSIAEMTAQLRSQREKTLALIESLKPEDYDRTATQPMFGTLTVLQWLRSYYRHDRMHEDQIAGREPEYKPRYATGSEPDQRRVRIQ
jgi:hypothetical protein